MNKFDTLVESTLNEAKVKTKMVSEVKAIASDNVLMDLTEKEWAKYVVQDLDLFSGEVNFLSSSFEVNGTTKSGKKLHVFQKGEYDMYGGPYDPEMGPITATLDNKDISADIVKAIKSYGSEGPNYDVARTDIWGHLVQ